MIWRFGRFFRRYRRYSLPLMSALLFFDVWASWHLQEAPAGANVWLAGFVCCWIWLDALDRDDA